MANINNTINPPKQNTDYALVLMPARSGKIKHVEKMPDGKRAAGSANVKTGTVNVPATESAFGRTVRYHEAMHASHTPKSFKPADAIDQGLEDARIHCHCSHASESKFEQARRDELTTALRDLRGVCKQLLVNSSTSVCVIRAMGILAQSKVNLTHAKLLDKACAKLGKTAKRDFSLAIALLKGWNGEQDSIAWQDARKIVAKYFTKDFDGTQGISPTPSKEKSEKSDSEDKSEQAIASLVDALEELEKDTEESAEESDDTDSEESEDSKDSESADSDSDDSEESDNTDSEDSPSNGEESDGEANDMESDTESESKESGTSNDSTSEESGIGKSDMPENIAPIIEQPKIKKPRKLNPEEYQGDLTPSCDKENYSKMQAQYPMKFYIKRLDMRINRVKLDLGRRAPLPVMSGGKILASRLVPAMTTPGVRVFARTANTGKGGTIVIDNSGSMAIPQETLIRFLEQAPALTIGYYNAPNDHCLRGSLYIYAANGYRANIDKDRYNRVDWPTDGGGNIIDYQVMAWLIKQPAPRYFVCDKQFTGQWEHAAQDLCRKLESSKQIIVVPNLACMESILDGKPMPKPCKHGIVAGELGGCYMCKRLRERGF